MAFDNNVVLVGNITREPELRFIQSGAAVCSFGLAWNQRSQQGEDKAHYFDVSCWRDLAEHAAESLTKGMRVVVYGRLDYRSWDSPEGEKRSAVQIVADEVSPSIKWATAVVTKTSKEGSPSSYFDQSKTPQAMKDRPIPDEEPF